MRRAQTPRHSDERGNVDMFALIWLAPVLLAGACLVVAAGRIGDANQQLTHTAEAAAQAAALARSPAEAIRAAQSVARSTLDDTTLCRGGPAVVVDTATFAPGNAVTVRVICRVRRDDLYGPFGAGDQTISAHASAIIDTYRAALP